MRALIVGNLEQQLRNSWLVSLKGLLEGNRFSGNKVISECLKDAFIQTLSGKTFLHLGELLTNSVEKELKEGNSFYVTLYRSNGYITDHTQSKESHQPLTDAALSIFKRLIKGENQHDETLAIYSELRHVLEKEIGKLLATDSRFQSYETWRSIDNKLEVQHEIHFSWYRHIPIDSISKEKGKFSIRPDAKLADLALIKGYGRHNEEDAEHYIEMIESARSESVIKYLQDATRGSDHLYFKDDIYFRQDLLQRVSIIEWLHFADSLKYPNLQDHLFLHISKLEDYSKIIRAIIGANTFSTPKNQLLFLALENYFTFADRTLTDLYGLFNQAIDKSADPNSKKVVELAKEEYERWLTKEIPDSFNEFMDKIFPDTLMHLSPHFISFFEWTNTHSYLYLTHPSNKGKIKLIDLLNEIFGSRLITHSPDRHFLIDNLALDQVNYEGLKKLVVCFQGNSTDHIYRNKLLALYDRFISNPKFMWFADGNTNFNASLNNTYNLSILLNGYPDGFKEWRSIYEKYRMVHEGWPVTPSSSNTYQREAFLFCAAVGISYNSYQNGDDVRGHTALWDALSLLIRQIRGCGHTKIIDYTAPLQFASITVGRYAPMEADKFLQTIIDKLDKIKYTLVAVYHLFESAESTSPPVIGEHLKTAIKEKINKNFWIIEQRKSEAALANQLNYYKDLKKICLDYLSK